MENFNIVETWLFTRRRLPSHSHPAGTALSSDWSVNSFIMVVYEKKIFLKFSQNFLFNTRLKIFLQTTIVKLFTNQSEVSSLPAGWFSIDDSVLGIGVGVKQESDWLTSRWRLLYPMIYSWSETSFWSLKGAHLIDLSMILSIYTTFWSLTSSAICALMHFLIILGRQGVQWVFIFFEQDPNFRKQSYPRIKLSCAAASLPN